MFGFLVEDYGLEYQLQKYRNCYGGGWYVEIHCFYNKNGCFSIYELGQRDEWDYFFAPRYSEKMEELKAVRLDICAVEKELWKEPLKIIEEYNQKAINYKTLGQLLNYAYSSQRLILETLAKVIKVQIEKAGLFYGLKVEK